MEIRQSGLTKLHRNGILWLPSLCLLLAGCGSEAPAPEPAELVFHNGAVYTVDEANSWAEAVAINDGSIIAVGTNNEVLAYAGDATRVVDLGGRMVMPGIVDSHVHTESGGRTRTQCFAPGTFDRPTREDFAAAILDCAERFPERPFYFLSHFGPNTVGPEYFNRQFIDELIADKPVVLSDPLGHVLWMNTAAVSMTGITAETEAPAGAIIGKDEDGELTGVFYGARGMMSGLRGSMQQESAAGLDEAESLGWALDELSRNGVTSVMDANVDTDRLDNWSNVLKSREVAQRFNLCMWVGRDKDNVPAAADLRAAFESAGLPDDTRICAKIYTDGILENGTSGLIEQYANHDHNGQVNFPQEQLDEIVADLDAHDIPIKAHSIGDRTTRFLLNSYEKAIAARGSNELRHHVGHIISVHPDDLPRFQELGVPAEFIGHLTAMIPYVESNYYNALGHDRFHEQLMPVGELIASGAVVSANSDWPAAILDSFRGLQTTVTRQDPFSDAPVVGPQNKIDLATAIRVHTINGAYLLHREDQVGSLEVGKAADLIVLDQNLFEIPEDTIKDTNVLLTLIGGDVAWQSPEFDLQ